ncbi:MAG: polysaccharide ABC transporter ATP-binding protein, partial [Flavobacterium sp.]
TKILGKEDPFLKIGQTNDRTSKGSSDIVWSLRDINFEIEQGDAVGIIGRNGAGKSTLLKLLSRVTSPTTGSIKVKGRIASLLEVGTGFHQELSGRENIFLNGAILGMRKKEIKNKFDEIVDFAGVERYIDTPVKRYSSGMYVRLAFAVAAHLESEILIVDEVLAVGDAEFQKKCLGKMGDISKGEGRTVLFVSHNMAAVQNLCSKGILLQNGMVKYKGETSFVVEKYLNDNLNNTSIFDCSSFQFGENQIVLNSVEILNNFNHTNKVYFDDIISIKFIIKSNKLFNQVSVGIGCITLDEIPLFTIRTSNNTLEEGITEVYCEFKNNLRAGRYKFAFGISIGERTNLYFNPYAFDIEILDIGRILDYKINNSGIVNVESNWRLNKL